MNHTTAREDVERVVRFFAQERVAADPPVARAATADRHPPAAVVRLERGRVDAATLATLPLFAGVGHDRLDRVAGAARLAVHRPGEPIARQWDAARDFFVIVDGTVEVTRDGEHVRDMGPGEFFGELAALEWGAGFSYPRLAGVTARTPVQAVVLGAETLNALLREEPELAATVRRAAAERLSRDARSA